MTSNKLTFVSFEPRNGSFVALLPLEGLITVGGDPAVLLQNVAKVYARYVTDMRLLIAEIQAFRTTHTPTPARKVWELGNAIFALREELEQLSLEMDSFYDHLVRDLGVKRKWLEKVIIFRRHLPDEELIPKPLNWGRCEKGTRNVAKRLRDGYKVVDAVQPKP